MRQRESEAYGRLCAEYYDLDKPRASFQTLRFYMSRAEASNGPILEPMCGTGSFLLPMLEQGLDVCGFDASRDMLAILNHKAKKLGLRPRVWQSYVGDLKIAARYGLIFIPNGSMNLLVEPNEAARAVAIFYNHLLPGGRLVFDLETEPVRDPGETYEPWVGEVARLTGGKTIRLTTMSVAGEPEVETSLCRYEVLQGDHVEEAEAETFRFRSFPRETMLGWLQAAGFQEVRFLRPHTEELAGPEVRPLVCVEAIR